MNSFAKESQDTGSFTLSLFDKEFLFTSDRPELLEKCLQLYYGYRCVKAPSEPLPDRYHLDFRMEHSKTPSEHYHQDGAVIIPLEGINNGPPMCYHPASQTGTVAQTMVNDQYEAQVIFAAMGTFVQLILKEYGLIFFHAAAVKFKNRGIMISGPNGSGKSTLMRKLLEAGAEYLADDATAVDAQVEPYTMLQNPELINIDEFPRQVRKRLLLQGFSKSLNKHFLMPPQQPVTAPVSVILFPVLVKGKRSVVSLTKKETFLKLLGQRKTPVFREDYNQFFQFCEELTRQAVAVQISIRHGELISAGKVVEICESI